MIIDLEQLWDWHYNNYSDIHPIFQSVGIGLTGTQSLRHGKKEGKGLFDLVLVTTFPFSLTFIRWEEFSTRIWSKILLYSPGGNAIKLLSFSRMVKTSKLEQGTHSEEEA